MSRKSTRPVSCPICGSAGTWVAFENRTLQVRVGDAQSEVAGLAGHACSTCEESLLDDVSAERFSQAGDALVLERRRQAGRELRKIREKLGLSQAQANQLSGGGHNAFSRYERGEAQPVAAVFRLFEAFDRHPHLVVEMLPGYRVPQTAKVVRTIGKAVYEHVVNPASAVGRRVRQLPGTIAAAIGRSASTAEAASPVATPRSKAAGTRVVERVHVGKIVGGSNKVSGSSPSPSASARNESRRSAGSGRGQSPRPSRS